jgi:hypothetical protein
MSVNAVKAAELNVACRLSPPEMPRVARRGLAQAPHVLQMLCHTWRSREFRSEGRVTVYLVGVCATVAK